MTRYVMIINLHDCVGCGTCDIVCALENQMPTGVHASYHLTETSGTFPDVSYSYRPVMCNHCTKAACVAACPTGAMHKDSLGLTVHTPSRCIACGRCAKACPYGAITRAPKRTAADQIGAVPQLMAGTSSGKDVQKAAGNAYPMHDDALDEYDLPMTKVGGRLKCQMCKHLVYHGDEPRCVQACPAGARIFGNMEDIYGEVYKLTREYEASVLKPKEGTEPAVYYIREFNKTW
ncbi:MAG: 4Fe-4S dicluster domain-containing protein [Coriobacteriales bacterium]|jgi:Fe-S-cluster-containing dehydrogenase component